MDECKWLQKNDDEDDRCNIWNGLKVETIYKFYMFLLYLYLYFTSIRLKNGNF